MNNNNDKIGRRWWEYPWYVLVLVFFAIIGTVMVITDILRGKIGRLGKTASYSILAFGLIIILGSWATYSYYGSVDLGCTHKSIIIEPGDSFESIVQRLVFMGVVDSRLMLKYPARLKGIDRRLTPGKYTFTGRNSCRSVLDRLRRADFDRIRVTIPEGSTIWRTAAILADSLDFDSVTFVTLNSDSALLSDLNVPCLEGFLFPETYFFPWGTSARAAASKMVYMYRTQTESVWPSDMSDQDRFHRIILASIVESETKVDSERVIVASVYTNRLQRNMRLDADPTVIYGLGGLDRPLYRQDLKQDSPYNTYRRKGLPPTPINSPGLAAIRAAHAPAETDYLFFVADNQGGHRFTRTNAEHNRAIREIRSRN